MFRKKCQKILAGLCALLLMGTGKSTVLVSSASEQKKNFGLEKPAEVQIPFAISVSGEEVPQSEFRYQTPTLWISTWTPGKSSSALERCSF